jgi:hypothetical protein
MTIVLGLLVFGSGCGRYGKPVRTFDKKPAVAADESVDESVDDDVDVEVGLEDFEDDEDDERDRR